MYTQPAQVDAEILEVRILAVISTAFFLESYIYDYGARKESGSFVDKYVDKLEPVAKWIIVSRLVCPPGLAPSDDVFEKVRKLFKLRNDLIHHKTRVGDDFTSPPEFPPGFEPRQCLQIVIDLLTRLQALDPSDDFGDFVLRHIASWIDYVRQDVRFYPILWEA